MVLAIFWSLATSESYLNTIDVVFCPTPYSQRTIVSQIRGRKYTVFFLMNKLYYVYVFMYIYVWGKRKRERREGKRGRAKREDSTDRGKEREGSKKKRVRRGEKQREK